MHKTTGLQEFLFFTTLPRGKHVVISLEELVIERTADLKSVLSPFKCSEVVINTQDDNQVPS